MSSGNGGRRLQSLLRNYPSAEPTLPLIHSTDAFGIGNILHQGGDIRPQECPVFTPDRLTYFFYGRPAYRPNLTEEPTHLDHYMPVCLIFRADFKINIKRIYPFDSGAYNRNFYKPFLHNRMTLDDFLIDADHSTPGRVVSLFFSDNTNYILGRSSLSETISPAQFEARSYEAIIAPKGANALDSRGAAIEVQTDQDIALKGNVEAAIIPSSQYNSEIGKALRDDGINVIPYSTLGAMRPNEYTGSIFEKCIGYLGLLKLIEEDRL